MIKPSAGDLEWFVKKFTPTGWIVDISNVTFIPYWVYDEFEAESKGIVNPAASWYHREAITAYFKQWNAKYFIQGPSGCSTGLQGVLGGIGTEGCPKGEPGTEGRAGIK